MKKLAIIIFGVFFLGEHSGGEVSVEERNSRFSPVSWLSIKMDDEWASPNARVTGYLRFDGSGDLPRVSLWENLDALREERLEYSLRIDTESSMNIINKRFGQGADNWNAMQNLYVEIWGNLKCSEPFLRSRGLGDLTEINLIEIRNNGLVLLVLD